MFARTMVSRLAGLTAAVVLPVAGAAQSRDQQPEVAGSAPVSVGGEFSATAGPRDRDAFFNYTDYKHNTLRVARLRLFGEWRLVRRVSVVGELRTEDGDTIEMAAAYARWRPWRDREFLVQVGRIPPVIGAFARRAYGRDNLVMGVPLAYQYLTSLRPDALPATTDDLLRMRGRGWRPSFPIGATVQAPGVPLVTSSKFDTGIEAGWRHHWLELAGAWSLGSPAVPVVRDTNDGHQWSGRTAIHFPDGLTLGASTARAQWLDRRVLDLLPADQRDASSQWVVGADLEFGWGPWLVRSEWLRSVFRLPMVAEPSPNKSLSAWAGFAEARLRLHPRWQVAARVERLEFSDVLGTGVGALPTPWDGRVERVEAILGFRATRRVEIRGGWQHNWRPAGRVHERGFPALQLLYWF